MLLAIDAILCLHAFDLLLLLLRAQLLVLPLGVVIKYYEVAVLDVKPRQVVACILCVIDVLGNKKDRRWEFQRRESKLLQYNSFCSAHSKVYRCATDKMQGN